MARCLKWNSLPSLPDRYGFAGMFSGVSNGALVLAGGTNFPEEKWGKGSKTWYDDIWILESNAKEWIRAGKIPYSADKGVSVTTKWGIIMAGGGNDRRSHSCVHLVRWEPAKRKFEITSLPDMPAPRGQTLGGLLDNAIYVACGASESGERGFTRTLFRMQLPDCKDSAPDWTSPRWETLEPLPGCERVESSCAVQNGALHVFSGYRLREPGGDGNICREFLRDAYAYQPGQGWKQIADMPRAAVAAPAFACGDSSIAVLGGHGGEQAHLIPVLKDKWRGFRNDALAYHAGKDIWSVMDEMPDSLPVNVNPVFWQNKMTLCAGEIGARIRTNRVLQVEITGDTQGSSC